MFTVKLTTFDLESGRIQRELTTMTQKAINSVWSQQPREEQ